MSRIARVDRAALTHFDRVRDPNDHLVDEVPPDEVGVVHAWSDWQKRDGRKGVTFHTSPPYDRALCGETVKAVMAIEFDPGDPNACQQCVAKVHSRTSTADA